MSKATFWKELESEAVYTMLEYERMIARIEAHGGRIVWPVETPAGDVCTCSDDHREWMVLTSGEAVDFGKLGPWHGKECPLYVPF